MTEEKDLSRKPEESETNSLTDVSETEAGEIESPTVEKTRADFWRNLAQPRVIAISIVALVIVVFALIYWLTNRNSQAGKPVPAPRVVTIDQPATDTTTGGQTLTIAPEQMTRAGIKTEIVGEQISSEIGGELATGVVEANAYRETPVVSLVGGVVRRVAAELGENVGRGQTVAVVFSDELATAQSNYLNALAALEENRKRYGRTAELIKIGAFSRDEFEQETTKLKTAESNYKTALAELDESRKRYQRTARLVQIGAASREELEQDTTKLKTAEANAGKSRADLDEKQKRFGRAGKILDIKAADREKIEQETAKLKTAESEAASAKQRLLVLGLSAERVNSLNSFSQVNSEVSLPAPASGTVTSRSINAGEVIEANKEILRVTDLSSVWIIAQVYEKDLARLRTGSGASATTDAFPDKVFRGQITYIDPRLDETTRTAQVRVEVANPDRVLKIGMYVRVAFGALGQAEQTAPVIPASAVQNLNNQQVVFAATSEPNIFELRFVRLGAETNGQYPVLEGINVRDKIVTSGSFLLRAEWFKQHPSIQ